MQKYLIHLLLIVPFCFGCTKKLSKSTDFLMDEKSKIQNEIESTVVSNEKEKLNTFIDFCNGESNDEDSIRLAKTIYQNLIEKNDKNIPKIYNCRDVVKWVDTGKKSITFDENLARARFKNPRLLINLENLFKLEIIGDSNNFEDTITTDLSYLENFPSLQSLKINQFNFDLPSVSKSLSVKKIKVTYSKLENPQFLKFCPSLEELIVQNSQVINLSGLADLYNLKKLYLNENRIVNLLPLQNLKSLKELNLDFNSILDLIPLRNLTSLNYLSLDNNYIEDLTSLESLTALETLFIDKNNIKICPKESFSKVIRKICDSEDRGFWN